MMSQDDFETIDNYCAKFIGHEIVEFHREDNWFNRLSLRFVSGNEAITKWRVFHWRLIGKNSLWRLETKTEMLCGSFDRADFIDMQLSRFIGRKLEAIQVRRPIFEASFHFDAGLTLHFFPLSAKNAVHWGIYPPFPREILQLGKGTNWYLYRRPPNDI
jgi:hypothetical protein